LLSPERVQRLADFATDVTEHVVFMRQRVALASRLMDLSPDDPAFACIAEVLAEARAAYPGHNVDANLMDDITMERLSAREDDRIPYPDTYVPIEKTWCRFVIGSGKPLVITDARTDLVANMTPHPDIVRSYLGVPLVASAWTVGALCVYEAAAKDRWSETDHRRITAWAARISACLDDALHREPHTMTDANGY